MDVGTVASFGREFIGQALQVGPEPPLPADIEELEDEHMRLKMRLEAFDEEGPLSGRRLSYCAFALVGSVAVYFIFFRKS